MLMGLMMAAIASASTPEVDRVAVVVGANRAPAGRAVLRYAHDDADRVAQTLIEVGGFRADAVQVLHDPRPAELLTVLDQLPEADHVIFFYYVDSAQSCLDESDVPAEALENTIGNGCDDTPEPTADEARVLNCFADVYDEGDCSTVEGLAAISDELLLCL